MGLFDAFKKKTSSTTEVKNVIPNSAITPEATVAKLNLRKETLKISLEKKSLQNDIARVCVVLDKSGSMSTLYSNGTVQSILERLLPIGMKFDDNGELDVWLFSDGFKRLDSIHENDFHDYVNRKVLNAYGWGGTNYAPVINDIVRKYVKEEPSKIPTFVIFITDGENSDHKNSEKAIIEASKYNIFFQFIGIGHADFRFLKELDEMDGRFIDNANFFEIKDVNTVTDTNLYDSLFNEYPSWLKLAEHKGLI